MIPGLLTAHYSLIVPKKRTTGTSNILINEVQKNIQQRHVQSRNINVEVGVMKKKWTEANKAITLHCCPETWQEWTSQATSRMTKSNTSFFSLIEKLL